MANRFDNLFRHEFDQGAPKQTNNYRLTCFQFYWSLDSDSKYCFFVWFGAFIFVFVFLCCFESVEPYLIISQEGINDSSRALSNLRLHALWNLFYIWRERMCGWSKSRKNKMKKKTVFVSFNGGPEIYQLFVVLFCIESVCLLCMAIYDRISWISFISSNVILHNK